jgi:diadenosine tetraphosphate (Ap4A) HIT family hydrolase
VATYFELGQAEINACTSLMQDVRKEVSSLDPTVDGFNVGINTGSTAGQTVPHCHIYLIPRRVGDVADPDRSEGFGTSSQAKVTIRSIQGQA